LFAPVLPYITEEIWSWAFAAETGQASIHRAPWPSLAEFSNFAEPRQPVSFDLAVLAFTAINKTKADHQVSAGRVVEHLTLLADEQTLDQLKPVVCCVVDSARVLAYDLKPSADIEPGAFRVEAPRFAPKPDKAEAST
jgi:valyl-tRNA synthetase